MIAATIMVAIGLYALKYDTGNVAARMGERALAPILADMPANEAAALTVALARRYVAPLLAANASCRIATALLLHGTALFSALFVHSRTLFR